MSIGADFIKQAEYNALYQTADAAIDLIKAGHEERQRSGPSEEPKITRYRLGEAVQNAGSQAKISVFLVHVVYGRTEATCEIYEKDGEGEANIHAFQSLKDRIAILPWTPEDVPETVLDDLVGILNPLEKL